MITTALAFALSMMANMHESLVTANETVRYEQLALIGEACQKEAEESEEWYSELDESYSGWDESESYWEPYYEPYYYEPYYYEPTYYAPSYDQPTGGLTAQSGVNYHDGRRETYYSSLVLYHYRTSEWTVDNEGFYRDSEGRYVVAASDMPQGSTFEGSKGTCIVLDSGCDAGTTDYYVNWN